MMKLFFFFFKYYSNLFVNIEIYVNIHVFKSFSSILFLENAKDFSIVSIFDMQITENDWNQYILSVGA